MRLAADALYAANIASGIDKGTIDPQIVLGYVYRGGSVIWSDSDWKRPEFAGRTLGTISTSAGYAADIWDAETGDGQPSDITLYRETCTNAGMVYCTVYAGLHQWLPTIKAIVSQEGLENILYWDSDATGVAHLNLGSVATQWAVDTQLHSGYDLSWAVDSPSWFGIDPIIPDPPIKDGNMSASDMAYDVSNRQEHFVNLSNSGAIWYNGYDQVKNVWLGPINVVSQGMDYYQGIRCMIMGSLLHVTATPIDQSVVSSKHWYCPLPIAPGTSKFMESNFP